MSLSEVHSVYLSGPMTGLPEFNFPVFDAAAYALRQIGFLVVSPHELDAGMDLDNFDLQAALERDVQAVADTDAVVLLPGWEDSPGAAVEVIYAEALGHPVFRLADVLMSVEFLPKAV
ncbi:DUF4406 domain-containing protein [Kribbella sp. WER1]